eukprot:PhM_4_TR18425/c6_g2_i3/m.85300
MVYVDAYLCILQLRRVHADPHARGRHRLPHPRGAALACLPRLRHRRVHPLAPRPPHVPADALHVRRGRVRAVAPGAARGGRQRHRHGRRVAHAVVRGGGRARAEARACAAHVQHVDARRDRRALRHLLLPRVANGALRVLVPREPARPRCAASAVRGAGHVDVVLRRAELRVDHADVRACDRGGCGRLGAHPQRLPHDHLDGAAGLRRRRHVHARVRLQREGGEPEADADDAGDAAALPAAARRPRRGAVVPAPHADGVVCACVEPRYAGQASAVNAAPDPAVHEDADGIDCAHVQVGARFVQEKHRRRDGPTYRRARHQHH